jgi:AraC-like DNA-binding protein
MGSMFAFGPLLLLYTRASTDTEFKWKRSTWLHFIPFLLNLLLNIQLFILPATAKVKFLDAFTAGEIAIRSIDLALLSMQILHFCIYLWLSIRWLNNLEVSQGNLPYMISMHRRIGWLRVLSVLFGVFLATVLALFALTIVKGHFVSGANYVFTLITSGIIYYTAFRLILHPELISPGFTKKYKTIRREEAQDKVILGKLQEMMEQEKVFTHTDLKLSVLASQLNTTPHQLSRLINDHFGKTYSEYINQYRVQEFLARLDDPAYATHNLMGIAWDVGFNSKSAFNVAFKKITGKNPSDFRK